LDSIGVWEKLFATKEEEKKGAATVPQAGGAQQEGEAQPAAEVAAE